MHGGKSLNDDPQCWTYDLGTIRVSASTDPKQIICHKDLNLGLEIINRENSMGQIAEFIMFHGLLTEDI